MADLLATDVTVTITHRDRNRRRRINNITLAFGDAAKTYPANGVPLPTNLRQYGLARTLEHLFPQQPASGGILYVYDPTNFTIRMYRSAGFTPAGTVSQPTFTGQAASMTGNILGFSWQNVKGADADVAGSMTTDQAAGPTNDDQIDTYHAVAAGAWTYSEDNEIGVPRNVALCLQNTLGGGTPVVMEEGALTATITGTFRGAAQTDIITETFTAGNKTIADTKFRWKYGVKPFDTITSVVITGLTATQNGLLIGIGLGRLLGVPLEPKDGVAGDFVKVLKNSANHAVVAYDDTNKTLDLGAIADNDDFDIEIEVASIGETYTPAGTVSQPTFTGNAVAAAALAEFSGAVAAVTLKALVQGV